MQPLTGRRLTRDNITPELELELVHRCQAGDPAAGGILVKANEGLICRFVNRYFGKGLRDEDVMQAARLGFYKGILKYSKREGVRVPTYALYWVTKEVHDALEAGATTIRLPHEIHNKLYRAGKSGEPMPPKLARAARLRRTTSTDVIVGDGDMTIADLTVSREPTPDVAVEVEDAQARRRELIARAMTRLTPRERELVTRRFAEEPEALARIGDSWGMSRERARQIEEDALTKMRLALRQIMSPDDAVLWGGKFPAGPIRPRPRPRRAAATPPATPELPADEAAPSSRIMAKRQRSKAARPTAMHAPTLAANDAEAAERAAP